MVHVIQWSMNNDELQIPEEMGGEGTCGYQPIPPNETDEETEDDGGHEEPGPPNEDDLQPGEERQKQEEQNAIREIEESNLQDTIDIRKLKYAGKDTKWGGHEMNHKAKEAVRVGTICIDSAIANKTINKDIERLLNLTQNYEIDVMMVSETAIGSDGFAARELTKQAEKRGYRTIIAAKHEKKYNRGTGTLLLIKEDLGKISEIQTEKEGSAATAIIQMEREELGENKKGMASVRVTAVYGPAGGADQGKEEENAKARRLAEWITTKMRKKETDVNITAGDMNAVPDGKQDAMPGRYQVQDNLISSLMATGLRDVHREVHPLRNDWTCAIADSRSRIDTILLKGEKTIPFTSGIMEEDYDKSVHYPAMTDILGIKSIHIPKEKDEERSNIPWRKIKKRVVEQKKQGKKAEDLEMKIKDELEEMETALEEMRKAKGRSADTANKIGQASKKIKAAIGKLGKALGEKNGRNTKRNEKRENNNYKFKLLESNLKVMELNGEKKGNRGKIAWMNIRKNHNKIWEMWKKKRVEAMRKRRMEGWEHKKVDTGSGNKTKTVLCREIKEQVEKIKKECKITDKNRKTENIRNAMRRRRQAARDNDTRSFFRMLQNKSRAKGGYMPEAIEIDGQKRRPRNAEEVRKATVQEHHWMQGKDWPKHTDKAEEMNYWEEFKSGSGDTHYRLKRNIGRTDSRLSDLTDCFRSAAKIYRNWNIFGPVMGKLTDEEWNGYANNKESATGISGLKIHLVKLIGGKIEAATREVCDKILETRLVSEEDAPILVCHIPKAAGGTRPIGLIEELLKCTSAAVVRRMTRALNAFGQNKVAPINVAYKTGRTCQDAILIDTLMSQWEERVTKTSEEDANIRLEFDLDGWFDGIVRILTELGAESCGVDQEVVEFWAQLSLKMRYIVSTTHGKTEEIAPKVGLTQGAQESPIKSVMCLDAWGRCLEKWIQNRYEKHPELKIKEGDRLQRFIEWAYADDGGLYNRARNLQRTLDDLGWLSQALCVCIKPEKSGLMTWDERLVGRKYKLRTYNWKEGRMKSYELVVKSAWEEQRKNLGVRQKGRVTSTAQQEHIKPGMDRQVGLLALKDLKPHEIGPALGACWGSILSHASICFYTTREFLRERDTKVELLIRKTLGLTKKVPITPAGTKSSRGGMEIMNATAIRLQDMTREYMVVLNNEETAGEMLRMEWDFVAICSSEHRDNSLLAKNINQLAGYGIYVRSMKERTLNRILDKLWEKEGDDERIDQENEEDAERQRNREENGAKAEKWRRASMLRKDDKNHRLSV